MFYIHCCYFPAGGSLDFIVVCVSDVSWRSPVTAWWVRSRCGGGGGGDAAAVLCESAVINAIGGLALSVLQRTSLKRAADVHQRPWRGGGAFSGGLSRVSGVHLVVGGWMTKRLTVISAHNDLQEQTSQCFLLLEDVFSHHAWSEAEASAGRFGDDLRCFCFIRDVQTN